MYPGIHASFTDMEMQGDILHEDYQRDLFLTMERVQFTGKIVTGGAGSKGLPSGHGSGTGGGELRVQGLCAE